MLFKPTVITNTPALGRAATQAVYSLHYGCSQRVLVRVLPCASLYEIEWPDIGLSQPANLTRCKAAALEWVERSFMTEHRQMATGRRLKSLNNLRWSASASAAIGTEAK